MHHNRDVVKSLTLGGGGGPNILTKFLQTFQRFDSIKFVMEKKNGCEVVFTRFDQLFSILTNVLSLKIMAGTQLDMTNIWISCNF